MSGPDYRPLPAADPRDAEPWGPPSPDTPKPPPVPVAAHRYSALRFCLAVVAAMEAGAALAIVPVWTPGRAAVAGVALGLGAMAAVTAVILMGTKRPVGKWLQVAIAVALIGSWWAPTFANSMADPTQARIPDLTLSVTCTVSPDAQSVTAQAEFSWQRLDLWPAGLTGASGTDSLVVSAQLPEWIDNELNWMPPYGPPPLVGVSNSTPGPWPAPSSPGSLTRDGRPSGTWATTAEPQSGSVLGPQSGSAPGSAVVSIRNVALEVGGHYVPTWTFQRNPDYEPDKSSLDMLPIFIVEYRHLGRFTVQAFGSCADRSRVWPNRSEGWLDY